MNARIWYNEALGVPAGAYQQVIEETQHLPADWLEPKYQFLLETFKERGRNFRVEDGMPTLEQERVATFLDLVGPEQLLTLARTRGPLVAEVDVQGRLNLYLDNPDLEY